MGRNDWISCSRCIKAFHLYCLEPMMYHKPPRGWFCVDHESLEDGKPPESSETLIPADMHVLPEDSISLDFFPYPLLPNEIPQRSKKRIPSSLLASQLNSAPDFMELYTERLVNNNPSQKSSSQVTNSLMGEMDVNSVNEFVKEMEQQQNKLLEEFMEYGRIEASKKSNNTVAAVDRMEPIMKQFTSWQRLMEVNKEMYGKNLMQLQKKQPQKKVKKLIPGKEILGQQKLRKILLNQLKKQTKQDQNLNLNLQNQLKQDQNQNHILERNVVQNHLNQRTYLFLFLQKI